MNDTSGKPRDGDDPDYRDDALSELMTGAYAATSMVQMSVPEELPELPDWEPSDDAPQAEVLDETAGAPTKLTSGQHPAVEAPVELVEEEEELPIETIDLDDEPPAPAVDVVPMLDIGPPSIDVPPSGEFDPAALDAEELGADMDAPQLVVDAVDSGPEVAASISTESGVLIAPSRAPAAELTGGYEAVAAHIRSPSPRAERRNPMIFIAVGVAVVAALGIGVAMMAGGDDGQGDDATQTKAAAAAVSPPQPEPSAEEDAPTEPAEAPPTPPVAPVDRSRAQAEYDAARARYEDTGKSRALIDMTIAACKLDDGPTARLAFRKLVGAKSRSKAILACRELGVDVTSTVDGYTGAELAGQAEEALAAGKHDEALELAKKSNRTERNQAALRLIVKAHCHLGNPGKAAKMMRHVSERQRDGVASYCADQGVEL
ncbi:MAG: hypothetical protein AAGA54_32325 [Myxococcota bacterium]